MVPPSSLAPSIITTALLLLLANLTSTNLREKYFATKYLRDIYRHKKNWGEKIRPQKVATQIQWLLNIQEDVLPTLQTWVQIPNVSYSAQIQNGGIYGI